MCMRSNKVDTDANYTALKDDSSECNLCHVIIKNTRKKVHLRLKHHIGVRSKETVVLADVRKGDIVRVRETVFGALALLDNEDIPRVRESIVKAVTLLDKYLENSLALNTEGSE